MEYETEYYHYQRELPETDSYPFYCVLYKQVSSKRPFIRLDTHFFYTDAECNCHAASVMSGESFTIEGYAMEIRKEAAKNGISISDFEYYRLVDFILDVLNDNRKPKERI